MEREEEVANTLSSLWYSINPDILSIRTSIIPSNAMFAIHYMNIFLIKSLKYISLPDDPKLKETLLRTDWLPAREAIKMNKDKALSEEDDILMRDVKIMEYSLELAKKYNTFFRWVYLIIHHIISHLDRLISASSAIDGRTIRILMNQPLPDKRLLWPFKRPQRSSTDLIINE